MKEFKLFINNEWVDAQSGETFMSYNPATGEPVAKFAKAGEADVLKAIDAAKAAFDSGVWSEMDPEERGELMRRAAEILKSCSEEFALYESMETGKSLRETKDVDVPYAIRALDYYSKAMATLHGQVAHIPGGYAFDYISYEPYGVVGAISPWNFPVHLFTRQTCGALAAGNCIVAKAASYTPSTTSMMAEVYKEAGFPAGVVNIVSGPGSVTGKAFFASKDIEVVSFTGSEAVGRQMLHQSAESPVMKKVVLELGGKGPIICHKDCDLSGAVNSTIQGFCLNQGEVCCASSRAYVHEDIYDKFVETLVRRCNALKVGHPQEEGTQIGALIDDNQMKIVKGFVDRAIKDGAQLLCGGAPVQVKGCEKGNFYPPTVLAPPRHDMEIVRDEVFGPVLVIFKYKELDDAIAMANDTLFGLGAAIWSEDPRVLYWTSKKLDAGTVWQNCNVMSKIEAPYGGNKNSGMGREDGLYGIMEYLKVKNNILFVGKEYDNFFGSK
jgi:acyl-CoA reductase-like NAD-dependent aldehyde dehydrogenase